MNRRKLIFLLAGAMSAARALRAQQKAMRVIGYLNGSSLASNAQLLAAFRQGVAETAGLSDKTWRSNTAGRRATMIGCSHWPPTSSAARST